MTVKPSLTFFLGVEHGRDSRRGRVHPQLSRRRLGLAEVAWGGRWHGLGEQAVGEAESGVLLRNFSETY